MRHLIIQTYLDVKKKTYFPQNGLDNKLYLPEMFSNQFEMNQLIGSQIVNCYLWYF
jgi:hypothetical protein